MKKILIGILTFLILMVILGGVFFLVDKAEYYSNGKTIFTVNSEIKEGLTCRIGLGYIMYTRSTGTPTNSNDNIIATWFNMPSVEEVVKTLSVESSLFADFTEEERQIAQYYGYLIMNDINTNYTKFNFDNIHNIYIDLNNLKDLKTDTEITEKTKEGIINFIKTKLEQTDINIENKMLNEVVIDSSPFGILKEVRDGIHLDIRKIKDSEKIELTIYQSKNNKSVTKYKYTLNFLNDDNYEIFEKIEN